MGEELTGTESAKYYISLQGTWGRAPCGQPSEEQHSELGRQFGRTIQ